MMEPVKIGIAGAAGRMGQVLLRLTAATEGAVIAGALERPGSPMLGRDAGELVGIGAAGVTVTDDMLAFFGAVDAVIDFTAPAALLVHAELAAARGVAYVAGMTGLEPPHFDALKRAAAKTAVVQSFNMSLGVNLVAGLVRQVAAALGPEFDIEIVEMHHRMKVDAPSGTAILFGEAAATGRGIALADQSERGRDGITGARGKGKIGFASLRGGNVVGDHSVIFAADDERIEITHKAGDRAIFARGAVRAALWAKGKPAGLYSMVDVLGLNR